MVQQKILSSFSSCIEMKKKQKITFQSVLNCPEFFHRNRDKWAWTAHNHSAQFHGYKFNFKFTFILHACGQPVLAAGTLKNCGKCPTKCSLFCLIILIGSGPEAKITKFSVKCIHNPMLDASVYRVPIVRPSIPGVRLKF